MANMISEQSVVRGADGRLYAIGTDGVAVLAESNSMATSSVRNGDRRGFDPADHEAARNAITPGV